MKFFNTSECLLCEVNNYIREETESVNFVLDENGDQIVLENFGDENINYNEPGDIIINCGDVFDNRTSINVKSMDLGIKIYEELSKIGPVHIIAGNHDIYYKTSTEISSLDILKYIPNVTVHKDVNVLEHDNIKFLMMPWQKDVKEESETLQKYQKESSTKKREEFYKFHNLEY